MTLYPKPHPGPLNRFNVAHTKTRFKIEITFGIVMLRFSCLRLLRLAPHWACNVTIVCARTGSVAMIRKKKVPLVETQPPAVVDTTPTQQACEASYCQILLQYLKGF